MDQERKKNLSIAALIGAAFLVIAVGGSLITSRHMNKTADDNAMSSGRTGDASPNLVQEQSNNSARGPATTGSAETATVPPAR
jgi:hypothetical protein